MSNEETIAPVRHTVLSGTTATAAGAVGGAVKGGVSTYVAAVVVCAVIGALAFSGVLNPLIPALTSFFGTAGGVKMSAAVGNAIWGLVGGGAIGALVVGPFTSIFGGLIGGVKGFDKASSRVSQEKGAAQMVDTQLAAYEAQAVASAQAPTVAVNEYSQPAPRQAWTSRSDIAPRGDKVQEILGSGSVDKTHAQALLQAEAAPTVAVNGR